MIYRITLEDDWQRAQKTGFFASADLAAEGFIHLSTLDTVLGTASRYYASHDRLRLLAIDDVGLVNANAEALKWEMSPSRKVLFPHCFVPLPIEFVVQTTWLTRDAEGTWVLPVEILTAAPN
jgi:uncharacterized protein (DUF952 family)